MLYNISPRLPSHFTPDKLGLLSLAPSHCCTHTGLSEFRGNLVPRALRSSKLELQLRRQPVIRKRSSRKTRSGAKKGTLLTETQQAPPPTQGSDRTSFMESHPKPKRGRPRKNTSVAANVQLQEAASMAKQNDFKDLETVETTHGAPSLSQLKPPSRSDQIRTGEEYVKVLQGTSSVLISEIIEGSDANRMIDLASKTFAFLDSIAVDYLPLYNAVHSAIRHQIDKEALEKQKQGSAFVTKALHDQIMSSFNNARETKVTADTVVEDARNEFTSLVASVEHLEEELKKAKEEKAKGEAKLANALAEKDICDNAFSKAEAELRNVADEMAKAQVVIEDVERRWNETTDGMNRSKAELFSLRGQPCKTYVRRKRRVHGS